MRAYVMRHGRRIEVEVVEPDGPVHRKRGFKARWVKLPGHWIEALKQTKSANTLKLAYQILLAAYEDRNGDGVVVLSAKTTHKMPHTSRQRAMRELAQLGLITVLGGGHGRAYRVKPENSRQ
jgi:hypothetical protein